METNGEVKARRTSSGTELPIIENSIQPCDFTGYDADVLMKETSKLRKLVTKKIKRNQAFTNVKTITKSSVTGKETLHHHPVRTEVSYPASGIVEKYKVT